MAQSRLLSPIAFSNCLEVLQRLKWYPTPIDRLAPSPGEAPDNRLAGKLLSRLKSRSMLLADRGYDADWIRELAMKKSAWANRRDPDRRHVRPQFLDRTRMTSQVDSVIHNPGYQPALRELGKPEIANCSRYLALQKPDGGDQPRSY